MTPSPQKIESPDTPGGFTDHLFCARARWSVQQDPLFLRSTQMTMAEDHQPGLASQQSGSAREAVNNLLEAGLLDELMERVDAGWP
jgi:hypothetical protein